jgi:hypothetical protein
MEDLIQNAQILFDELPPPTMSYDSFLSSEGSTTRHHPGIPTSTQSSSPASHSDSPVEGRRTPTLTPFLSPLLGPTSSQTLMGSWEMTMQEQVIIPEPTGTQAVETSPNSPLPDVAYVPPTPVGEWWLPQPGLRQQPESPTISQSPSPSESVTSSTTDLSLSASLLSSPAEYPSSPAASLLSEMGTFSPTVSERF